MDVWCNRLEIVERVQPMASGLVTGYHFDSMVLHFSLNCVKLVSKAVQRYLGSNIAFIGA
jgi:hypothetical protein